MSFYTWSERKLARIERDFEAVRPERVPGPTVQADEGGLVRLTWQQKEDWAEAISRHLPARTVSRYLADLRILAPLPTLWEGQRYRVEAQMLVLGIAKDKVTQLDTATPYSRPM